MYLGIDLGTTNIKVVLADDSQLVAEASGTLTVSRPHPLWSEQSPNDWWRTLCAAVNQLRQQYPDYWCKVRCIGLTGQMHGATLLGSKGEVLRPAILWNDGRSADQCATFEQRVPNSRDLSGNIAMPGFTAPKLIWIKEHEPEVFRKIHKVLLPKDYLRYRLSGDYASDMSDSAGTLWLDVANRTWSDALLDACELTTLQMPDIHEGNSITGTLMPDIASAWGLDTVPIVAGGGDNAAGAVGMGVIDDGQAFISLGTSGVYFVASNQYKPNSKGALHTFCHCLPNTWHQMSVILSASSCLTWLKKIVGASSENALLEEAQSTSNSHGVTFLPYLSGERTPHNNPYATGVFIGMTQSTKRSHMVRALLEGVAYAFADGQRVIEQASVSIGEVCVIGGGAKSELWGQILANVLGRTLLYREGAEFGPAYGAAKLAQAAIDKADIRAVCAPGKLLKTVQPDKAMHDYHARGLHTYRRLYQQLETRFQGGIT